MQLKKLDIEVKNELYDPASKKPQVLYMTRGVRNIYRSRLYVIGPEVDKIKEVRYTLHPTFPNPVRIAENRKNNFETIIWAWGEFTIYGVVITSDDGEYPFIYQFRFRDQLLEAEKKEIPFIQK